jgi:ribose 5-phosphate isomerase B
MTLFVGSDHGGFELKEQIKAYLDSRSVCDIEDLGTYSEASVDYPEFGKKVALAVAQDAGHKGIVVCGSGIGISIAANKVTGIRAALCHDVYMAVMSRKHNDANVLALGGRTTLPENAFSIIDAWLATEFEGGRHQRRVDQIES